MTSIEELMHGDLVTAEPSETVEAVVGRMREAGVGAAVIVEDGALRALFTERDLLTRVVGDGRDPAQTPVIQASTEQVVSVEKGTPIRTCTDALKKRKVRHLPVVEGGRPIGIVSARDFFELLAGRLEGLVDHLRYENQLAEGEDPYDHLGGSYGR